MHPRVHTSSSFFQSMLFYFCLNITQLNKNQLRSIDKFAFSCLSGLKRLHLSDEKNKKIDEAAFDGSTSLIKIDLNNNNLTSID